MAYNSIEEELEAMMNGTHVSDFDENEDYVDPELYRSIAHNLKLSKMSVGIINFNIIVCFASVSHFIEKIYRITPWWFYIIVPFYRFKNLHIISGIVVIIFIFIHIIPHIINSVYLYNNNNFCTTYFAF